MMSSDNFKYTSFEDALEIIKDDSYMLGCGKRYTSIISKKSEELMGNIIEREDADGIIKRLLVEGYIFFPFNAIAQDIKYEEKSSQLLLEIKERVLDVLEQLLEDTAGYEFPDELENIENMSYEQMKELYSKHVKDGSRLYKFVHRLNNKYSVVDDDRFKKVVKEYIGNGERWSDFPSEEIIDRKIDTIY